MAELGTIDGEPYKNRSPTGVWLRSVATFTVYWYFWYYKVNDERSSVPARRRNKAVGCRFLPSSRVPSALRPHAGHNYPGPRQQPDGPGWTAASSRIASRKTAFTASPL
jgi:hypothetical protein